MHLFELEGTITAIGQSTYNNDVAIYAYLEITDPGGGRVLVEKCGVCNDVASKLAVGISGRFYVDRIFRASGSVRCQLWGLRTDRATIIDRNDIRKQIAKAKILYGIMTTPVLGIGLILVASGIHMLIVSQGHDRQRFFYGGAVPPPLPEPVRI